MATLRECITRDKRGSREASALGQETMAAWTTVGAKGMENYKHLGWILRAELAGLADKWQMVRDGESRATWWMTFTEMRKVARGDHVCGGKERALFGLEVRMSMKQPRDDAKQISGHES